jgi:hypothetical protein
MFPAKNTSFDSVQSYLKGRLDSWEKTDPNKRGHKPYIASLNDLRSLDKICQKYSIPFEWLCNLINFESAKTFSPSVKNPTSSASGLIQFMETTAKGLGTTTSALRSMTFQQQLVYVDKYIWENNVIFKKIKDGNGRIISKKAPENYTEADLYMMIFYPKFVGKPLNTRFPSWVTNSNPGIYTKEDYFKLARDRAIFKDVPSDIPNYINWYNPTFNQPSQVAAKTNNLFFFILLGAIGLLIFNRKK